MADFLTAMRFVQGNEGSKLLDDPKTGEYSRFGITLATASGYGLCAPDDRDFILHLTQEKADAIYLEHFWTPLRLSDVNSQSVATKLLDMGVNMGSYRAVRICQQALNAIVAGGTLKEDGQMGPATVNTINCIIGVEVLLELRAKSLEFYQSLVKASPDKYAKYWETWKARATK